MSAAAFIAIFGSIFVCVSVALFLCMMTVNPEAERQRRRARARDLARYRHHPDANLLSLSD